MKKWPFAKLYWPGIFTSPQWAGLDKTEKALIYVLLLRADESYTAWPSHKELEQASGYQRNALLRALDRLLERGLVTIEQRNGTRNRYHVDVWKPENMMKGKPAPINKPLMGLPSDNPLTRKLENGLTY